MKKEKNYFWLSYIFIIFIILMIIIFIIPDNFFAPKKGVNPNNTDTTNEFPFKEYSDMFNKLKENNYTYKYEININTTKYYYEGSKTKDKEKGIFKSGNKVSEYSKLNDYINHNLVDVNYIYNLIENIKPKKNNYDNTRMYTYNLELDNLETDITIYTDLNNITKIVIANIYYQYNLSYSFIGDTTIS